MVIACGCYPLWEDTAGSSVQIRSGALTRGFIPLTFNNSKRSFIFVPFGKYPYSLQTRYIVIELYHEYTTY